MEGSKLKSKIESSFLKLKSFFEAEKFAGWDPYDGLNSKIFQALPIKHWDLARLAWIQGFKRSPINFRQLLLVPKQHNAKGIGLFLSGYCNLYNLALEGETAFGTKEELLYKINELANLVDELKIRTSLEPVGVIIFHGKPGVCSYFQKIRQQLWLLLFVWRLCLKLMKLQKMKILKIWH